MVYEGHLHRHKAKHEVRFGRERVANQVSAAKDNAIPADDRVLFVLSENLECVNKAIKNRARKRLLPLSRPVDSPGGTT